MTTKRIAFLLLVCALLVGVRGYMRPTPSYERAMNASIEAYERLKVCRAASTKEPMKDAECFEEAVNRAPYNATWYKQLAAIYTSNAMRVKAYLLFNRSAFTILEAQGFVGPKAPKMSVLSWLKLYHTREHDGAIELAKVLVEKYQYEHVLSTAHMILEQFLLQQEEWEEMLLLYRTLGNVVSATKIMPQVNEEQSKKKRQRKGAPPAANASAALLGEELPVAAEHMTKRLLSAPLTSTAEGRAAGYNFTRDMCGVSLEYKSSYTLAEVIRHLTMCVARDGHFKDTALKEGEAQLAGPYTALMKTSLHQMAALGSDYLVRNLAEAYPAMLQATDNFGRTPMHYAAAHRHNHTVALLLQLGGRELLKAEDAGRITPIMMACRKRAFRREFERVVGSVCGPHPVEDRIHDEESDDDTVPRGGGWRHAALKDGEDTSCDFDVRTGDSVSHTELVGRYLHSSEPVVLRNIFPSNISKILTKAKLTGSYHNVTVRKEPLPWGNEYGAAMPQVLPLVNFTRNCSDVFGCVEVTRKHLMYPLLNWMPPKLVPGGDECYTTVARCAPTLIIAGKGATTNHAMRHTHSFFAVAHGLQDWVLYPPSAAVTTRQAALMNISESSQGALHRCTIQGGDILIIPALWSSAFRSRGESVTIARRFNWK